MSAAERGLMLAAHAAVSLAIVEGRLQSPTTCEACNRPDRRSYVLHHHDYTLPLDVIPLCGSCHQRVHSGKVVEPRTGRRYTPAKRGQNRSPETQADCDVDMVRQAIMAGQSGARWVRPSLTPDALAYLALALGHRSPSVAA